MLGPVFQSGRRECFFSIFLLISLLVFTSISFSGCKKDEKQEILKLDDTLTVLIWEEYILMDVVEEFEAEYGVEVIFEYFDNEDEMISLVQSSPESYDLVIASGSVVETLVRLRLLYEIEKEHIPNLSKVDRSFANPPFDMEGDYSVPYMWGTSGIAVNRKYVFDENIDWGILFDDKYAGKIDMLDDIQENFAPALKLVGASINSIDDDELNQALDLLLNQKEIIRGYFNSFEVQKHLEDGSTYVAYLYSGDTFMAAEKNEDIEYIVPESGAPIWMDNWVIPATSNRKYTAEVFINFILKPQNIARISNFLWYANAVSESKEYLSEELLNSKCIYISDDLLDECEYYKPLGNKVNKFMNKVWFELRK